MPHKEIIERLCLNNFEVHVVGGAIRDWLLGLEPTDVDLVTNATVEQIADLFSDKKVDLVGANFQVTIVDSVEVATYRSDAYVDGVLDKTMVVMSLEEDLSRRDLTINSIAMCQISGDIIDLFGGIQDLKDQTIKFVNNPTDRINEDPCRILRACRFAAKVEGNFENETDNALRANHDLVRAIAPERIRKEIMKAMEIKYASTFFEKLYVIEALDYIFPALTNCMTLDGGDYHAEPVGMHCSVSGDSISPKFPLLKLAVYLHDIGKYPTFTKNEDGTVNFYQHEKVGAEIVREELTALKFSGNEIKYISDLIYYHMRCIRGASPKAIRRLMVDLTKDGIDFKDLIRMRIADRKGNFAKVPHTISEIKEMINLFRAEINRVEVSAFSVKDLAVNGNDAMTILGINPGMAVGLVLSELFESVIENPELNTREKLIELLMEKKCLI